jgi:hypothetical protein
MRFETKPHVRHLLNVFATPTKIMMENANLARDNLPQTLLSMLPRVLFCCRHDAHSYIDITQSRMRDFQNSNNVLANDCFARPRFRVKYFEVRIL